MSFTLLLICSAQFRSNTLVVNLTYVEDIAWVVLSVVGGLCVHAIWSDLYSVHKNQQLDKCAMRLNCKLAMKHFNRAFKRFMMLEWLQQATEQELEVLRQVEAAFERAKLASRAESTATRDSTCQTTEGTPVPS